MSGGVSHVESFDHKPRLFADDGKKITVDNRQGKHGEFTRYLRRLKWGFQPAGQNGTMVSERFPQTAGVTDDLCVIRALSTDHTNHDESLAQLTAALGFLNKFPGWMISSLRRMG